jgi:hypothetical protein
LTSSEPATRRSGLIPLSEPPRRARRFAFTCLAGLALAAALPAARAAGSPAARNTAPPAAVVSDPTLLQCGNLIYCGNRSSVCFADRFLGDVAQQTTLRVNRKFVPVRLDSETLYDFPFCVMSGNEEFTLAEKERSQLRRYLRHGGFLLVSPGCSDEKWDKAFRKEIKLCFPDLAMQKVPMDHPIFSVVHKIPRLTDKSGKTVSLEALEINGRLVLLYSKDGLNDVANASGCCCCGGNEIRDPAKVNVNVFTYAALY